MKSFNDILKGFNPRKGSEQKVKVGLDIGQSGVRALILTTGKDKPRISAFAYSPIERNTLESVRQVVNSLNLSGSRVNIGLSGSGVIIRYINLPKMTKEELRGALQFEAEKHIPFPVKEVFLDAHILDEPKSGQMLVLLAAVKKELVQQSIQMMHSVGLEINIIEVSTIALINAFLNFQEKGEIIDKSFALLDIGIRFSNLTIIENGLPRLTRDIPMGSRTASATTVLNIDNEQENATASSAPEAQLLNLSEELRRSFDFYESQSGRPLEVIYLSGEGTSQSGIEQSLNQNLSLTTKFWDPTANLNIDNKVNKEILSSQVRTIAIALGLALR